MIHTIAEMLLAISEDMGLGDDLKSIEGLALENISGVLLLESSGKLILEEGN